MAYEILASEKRVRSHAPPCVHRTQLRMAISIGRPLLCLFGMQAKEAEQVVAQRDHQIEQLKNAQSRMMSVLQAKKTSTVPETGT